jgi:hypothetical protein
MQLGDAMRVFEGVAGHPFNFLHCWMILRGERKWEDKLKGVEEGQKKKSRMPADPSSTAQGTDSEGPDSASRPMGRDAAKKRRSMQQSGSETSTACLAVLQQMTTTREAGNQAQAANVETFLDVEAKKLAAKLENNSLQKAAIEVQQNLLAFKMSRGSPDDQWSDEKIMSLNMTQYTPLQRQYWEERQMEVMNRRRNSSG